MKIILFSKEVIERQKEDRGIASETKLSNNSADSLNLSIKEDDRDYFRIDVSNYNENNHKKDKFLRSASLSKMSSINLSIIYLFISML